MKRILAVFILTMFAVSANAQDTVSFTDKDDSSSTSSAAGNFVDDDANELKDAINNNIITAMSKLNGVLTVTFADTSTVTIDLENVPGEDVQEYSANLAAWALIAPGAAALTIGSSSDLQIVVEDDAVATDLDIGMTGRITSIAGTTTWVSCGAASETIGLEFTVSGADCLGDDTADIIELYTVNGDPTLPNVQPLAATEVDARIAIPAALVDSSPEIVAIINDTPSTLLAVNTLHGDVATETEVDTAVAAEIGAVNMAQFSNANLGTLTSGADDPMYIASKVEWTSIESSCDDTATALVVTMKTSATANGTYAAIGGAGTDGVVDPDGTTALTDWDDIPAGSWLIAEVTTANTGDAEKCHMAFLLTNVE